MCQVFYECQNIYCSLLTLMYEECWKWTLAHTMVSSYTLVCVCVWIHEQKDRVFQHLDYINIKDSEKSSSFLGKFLPTFLCTSSDFFLTSDNAETFSSLRLFPKQIPHTRQGKCTQISELKAEFATRMKNKTIFHFVNAVVWGRLGTIASFLVGIRQSEYKNHLILKNGI
jgi:hypothetical protein